MSPVFAVAAPVFATALIGFFAGRARLLNKDDAASLNKFVVQVAVPIALFGLTASAGPLGQKELSLVSAYAIGMLCAIFGGYFVSQILFGLSKPEAGAHGFSSTLGNAIFLGLPIALSIEGWAAPFVSIMLIEGVFVMGIGITLISPRREGDARTRLMGIFAAPLKSPIVIAMIAGFLYSTAGLPFSGPFKTFTDFFAHAGGPIALFSLGFFFATRPIPALGSRWWRVATVAIVKLCVLPTVALSLAYWFGVSDPAFLGALALFCFLPTGVFAFILASQFGVYEEEAATAVTVTSILSLVTISGVLTVFA